jgi:tetracycline resistance efflux pump
VYKRQVDGFNLFLRTIPFNLYALLTILFMLYLIIRNVDYGTMRAYEARIKTEGEETSGDKGLEVTGNGKVIDLVLPIAVLIVFCISAMLYTGGLLDGVGIVNAFADCDSAKSLVLGSFFTLVVVFVMYLPRKVITFREFCDSFVEGFKAMTPAIMILCLAWTLSGVCNEDYLNIGGFVSGVVGGSALVGMLLPAILFVVATGLSFATGTSWGTFGILIPIAVQVVGTADINMLTITTAAILAGAVCGDHISPISDTTILASAGAQCNHINHVSTQIPYALTVAGCCLVGFLAGGIAANGWIGTLVGLVMLAAVLLVVGKKANTAGEKK